ncbi:MAG TPA: metallophosphoesterase family protein [Bacteroidales bacterium]|nr:metallophosphoesterase family protein [Bacteroidales bacterium]HRZ47878.1 metallophosphoesterase family protein [Bacteroidales bacterium]
MKIALISDIHEDYNNLIRVARLIEKHHCHEVLCLGDIVGFSVPWYTYYDSRNASLCVRWVKENCRFAIAGNHDLYAVRRIPAAPVRGFVYPENWYLLPFSERSSMAAGDLWLYEDNELSALLDDDTRDYLLSLPEEITATYDGIRCLFTHFIQPDITGSATRFLLTFNDLLPHFRFMQLKECTLGFSGHMHCDGLLKTYHHHDLMSKGFNRKVKLASPDWIGLPSVTGAKNTAGFMIWDTAQQSVEAISLRKISLKI